MNPSIPIDGNSCVQWPIKASIGNAAQMAEYRGQVLCDGMMHHSIRANEHTGKAEAWVIGWCPKSVEGALLKKMVDEMQTFENFDSSQQQKAYNQIHKWVDKFDVKKSTNLILTGDYGTGKTHIAKACHNKLRQRGYFVMFIQSDQLLPMFLASSPTTEYSEDHKMAMRNISDLERADFVVFDDLGSQTTKSESDYFKDRFRALVDRMRGRYIITTNSDHAQLRERLGDAIISRIMENSSVIEMKGKDYRQIKGKK